MDNPRRASSATIKAFALRLSASSAMIALVGAGPVHAQLASGGNGGDGQAGPGAVMGPGGTGGTGFSGTAGTPGGDGSNGGARGGGGGGSAGGGAGGAGGGSTAGGTAAGAAGADGADGSTIGNGGGGGAGGNNGNGSGAASINNNGTLAGSAGGNGGKGGSTTNLSGTTQGGGGGGGGGGGIGAIVTGATSNTNAGTITGGAGGAGGKAGLPSGYSGGSGYGGDGGAGGIGVYLGSAGVALENSGQITGGAGGSGSDGYGSGGASGSGGAGTYFAGASASLNNSGSITGGTGGGYNAGAGGAGAYFAGQGATVTNSGTITAGATGYRGYGFGPSGAVGLYFAGTGATLTNLGTIAGGANGNQYLTADGGAGVYGTGLTIINNAAINGGNSINGSRGDAITFAGGANYLTTNSGGSYTGNIGISNANSGSLTLLQTAAGGATGSTTYSNVFTGTGSLTVSTDSGYAVTLSGANTYSGGTVLTAGTLYLSGSGTLGAATGTTTISNGTLDLGQTTQTQAGVNLNGGTLRNGALNAAITATGGTLNGIGGTASLTTTSGTTTVLGNNSYSGATAINGGTLRAGATGAFNALSATTVATGAVIDLNNFNQALGSLAGTGNVTLGSATLTIGGLGTNTSFSGAMSGSGGLTKTGAGTLTFGGVNTYSGGTLIAGGTLHLSGAGTLGASTGTTTISSGTLDLGQTTQTQAGVNLSGGTLQNGTLNAGVNSTGGTVNGIGGNASLTTTSGTTIVLGSNSYSGGTFISGGTLQLSGAATLGAATGTTTISSGTLDLGQTIQTQAGVNLSGGTVQNGALNAPITSTGGTISGIGGGASLTTTSGTTVLLGSNGYSGATSINGGVLQVDGAITGTSSVTVGRTGTLTGTGLVDPLIVTIGTGGTLTPGTAGAPGTSMTIEGNLAFQSGALYVVYLNPVSTTSAKVTGTASLAGTVQANFATGTYLTRQYVVLQSAGLSGSFSDLTTTNLPAGFTASLAYSGNNVLLNLLAALPAANLNANQRNVATSLNTYFNAGGSLPPGFIDIFRLSGSALATAMTQLDGEVHTGAKQAASQLTSDFLALTLDPFVSGRGFASIDTSGRPLSFAASRPSPTRGPTDAFASMPSKAPALAGPEPRWSTWASGFGGNSTTGGDAAVGSSNLTANSYGVATGLDYRLTPTSLAGFALAGAGTNWSLANGLGSGRSDAVQVGVYGTSWFGPAYVGGSLAFSNHWFSTSRTALGNQLSADFTGQSYGLRLEGGYRVLAAPNFAVTPYGAVQVQDFRTPAYGERESAASGFGLSYVSANATTTRAELGARSEVATQLFGAPVALYGRLAWAHDFTSTPALTASFEALPGSSFIVTGASVPNDTALTTAGARFALSDHLSLIAKFDGQFARTAQTYSGSGTLRYAW